MINAGKYFGYAAILTVVVFVAWLLWVFVTNINAADSSIKAGLIGIFGALSVGGVAHYQTKKREIVARHFENKREGYTHVINLIFDIIRSVKKGEELGEDNILKKIIPFKKALIVWGSPEIIEAWNRFEQISEKDPSSEMMFEEMENILRAIRKDLGHDDSQLTFGSITKLLIIAEDKEKLFAK